MLGNLKLGAIVIIAILILDYLWLNFVAKSFYVNQLAALGRIENGTLKPVIWAAVIVYILLAVATVVFALPRVTPDDSLFVAFGYGALLGLVIYGVYDMTNYTTLKDWPLLMSWADMAWGTFLGGAVAALAKYARESWL